MARRPTRARRYAPASVFPAMRSATRSRPKISPPSSRSASFCAPAQAAVPASPTFRKSFAMFVSSPNNARGRATLVGAGPGDPDLLTLRAVKAIQAADAILFDALIDASILDLARPDCRRIDVGKRCGRHAMQQRAINALIVKLAQAGRHVVRLKGGDPILFGRGGEELDTLRAASVPV